MDLQPNNEICEFRGKFPNVCMITTASLPWLTGTAVAPSLRAAQLWKMGFNVTFLSPWVPPEDQAYIFPPGVLFENEEDHMAAMRICIQERLDFELPPDTQEHAGLEEQTSPYLRFVLYKARYSKILASIIPMKNLQSVVPADASWVVLEEPEHLTWFHWGKRWTRAFGGHRPVIGVLLTDYVEYSRRNFGKIASVITEKYHWFLCQHHIHKAVKLSDAIQKLPQEESCFSHGVAASLLEVGGSLVKNPNWTFSKGAYFIGKAVWAKGFDELLDRYKEHDEFCKKNGIGAGPVDVYGNGPDWEAIQHEARSRKLPLKFVGPKDHISRDMAEYRTFINPSTSDTGALTSAEALAMGKWVIVPKHPGTEFFSSFKNCLVYDCAEEFSKHVLFASKNSPHLLTQEEICSLTWHCGTTRFLQSCMTVEINGNSALERIRNKVSWMGYNLGYFICYMIYSSVLLAAKLVDYPRKLFLKS